MFFIGLLQPFWWPKIFQNKLLGENRRSKLWENLSGFPLTFGGEWMDMGVGPRFLSVYFKMFYFEEI